MNISALESFLTKDNINLHLEYLKTQRLKYSIIEKSIPAIKGKSFADVLKMRLSKSLENEILPLIISIKSHEIYFSSFSSEQKTYPFPRCEFSSDPAFRYSMLEKAKASNAKFLYAFNDRGILKFAFDSEAPLSVLLSSSALAIDLCEHAYFLDYRFEREAYLRSAVRALNIPSLANGS